MTINRSFIRDSILDLETKKVLEKVLDFLEPSVITITGGQTLSEAVHGNKIVRLSAAAGQAIVLPAALGTGATFRLYVATSVTSNTTTIKVANATDVMSGNIIANSTGDTPDLAQPWPTAASSDTITLNGSTLGGLAGDWITLIDVAAGVWAVQGVTSCSGVEATPFSATVS